MPPKRFVAKWRHATLNERSAAQEHFIDPAGLTPAGTAGSTATLDRGVILPSVAAGSRAE